MDPEIFQLEHITSNLTKESELQIRYHDGQLDNISKEDIYNILMTQNLDNIMKISWDNNKRRLRGGIIKGEHVYSEIVAKYNINPNDYYIIIQNFSFNQYRMPMKYHRLYCNTGDNYFVEIIDVYKIQQHI